ncbi:dihydroneopterin aldolase [Lewinella cohaerens]|uniref:dihydroneopterin aldolase n=1 Tax=Lewinella cohaerens TaxID=70995 RepID=UPI00036932A7|nr:dihydroneopterin aldolase [Lewinella cohaerens]
MALIGLEGMRFNGPHGFYPEEEVLGNDFLIDIYLDVNTRRAAMHDDLGSTVNYETVYLMVQSEMKKSAQLIETLADRIVSRISEFYDNLKGIRLVVRKLNPPLSGQVAAAYIEVKTGSFSGGGGGGGKMSSLFG